MHAKNDIMNKHLPFFLVLLTLLSCDISRNRGSEMYLPGPAIRDGYSPMGLVEELQYSGSVPGPTHRRMIVYLPPDYYRTERRFPVLYLLHGARGYETSWIRKGHVYQSTDSLWREGLAEPCIVVMPNVNQYKDDEDYEGGRFKGAWESILEVDGTVEYAFVHDVVNLVDSLYRTVPDKAHRAVAGLSIGGYQSIYLAANHPDIFGYIGSMSPYTWCKGRDHGYRKLFYGHLYQKMAAQFADEPPLGFYLYAGKWDIMLPSTQGIHHRMKRKGFSHEFSKYSAGHGWNNGWIEVYKDMLKKLFKNEDTNRNQ